MEAERQYQKDMKQLVGEQADENNVSSSNRDKSKDRCKVCSKLKNVLQGSLPQGLIPANRVDHNLRKFVPSARSKDEAWFTSIIPEKFQTDCHPVKHGKIQVLKKELPLLRR